MRTLFVWLMAAPCLAQTAVIDGPVESKPGDLVVLDASKSDASDYAWTLIPAGKSFLPVDGGVRVVFASGDAGRFVFVLSTAKDGKVAVATHEVVIGTPKPVPPPTPPGPTPVPIPEPTAAQKAAVAGITSVLRGKPDEAVELQTFYGQFADVIATGTTPLDFFAVRTAHENALAASFPTGHPVLSVSGLGDAYRAAMATMVGTENKQLDAAGRQQVAAAYRAIAWACGEAI